MTVKRFLYIMLSVLLLGACSQTNKFVEQRYQMATVTQIQVLAPTHDARNVRTAMNSAFDAIDHVEQVASWFIDSSDACRIANAAPGTLVTVNPLMMKMLCMALMLNQETDGRFDVTAGRIIRLWGFGPDKTNRVPSEAQIAEVLRVAGMDKLVLLPDQNAVSTVVAGVQCDVSSLAAGLAADEASRVLLEHGYSNFLVNAGGEIRTSSTGEKIWNVGVQVPTPDSRASEYIKNQVIKMKRGAVSTSGSYKKFFTRGTNTYTHIVNPRTGRPIQSDTISVTVLAEECMDADGWSTALFCLPADEAIALADQIPDIECLVVERPAPGEDTFRFKASKNFPAPRE
jgi:thiamine biosynthesis lipoprotein